MLTTRLVLGYHGCDEQVAQSLLSGQIAHLKPSNNPYDWLGSGIYFFEDDLERAWHFVRTAQSYPDRAYSRGRINSPAVVGAVIELSTCLDMAQQSALQEFSLTAQAMNTTLGKLPLNKTATYEDGRLSLRRLDRAIFQFLHQARQTQGLRAYDSVRGYFEQGDAVAPTSAFKTLSHYQIAVRNTQCIRAYFDPSINRSVQDSFQGLVGN